MVAWVAGEAEGVLVGVVENVEVGDTVTDTILLWAVASDVTTVVIVFSEETVPVKITKNYYTDKQILKKDDYFKMTKNI